MEQARLFLERNKRKRKRRKRRLPRTSSLSSHVLVADIGSGMFLAGFLLRASAGLSLVWTRRTVLIARSSSTPAEAYTGLVLLVLHLALCSFLLSSGPRCLSSWAVWTRRSVTWCRAENCGFSAVAAHRPGRRFPCLGAEADSNGLDCSSDQRDSPVAPQHGDRCLCCTRRAGHSCRDAEAILHGIVDHRGSPVLLR